MTNSKRKLTASEKSKKASSDNIKRKIAILRKWASGGLPWMLDDNGNFVRDSNGDKQPEWFPRNVLQFSKWDGSQNSSKTKEEIGEFKSTSRDTLDKSHNAVLKNQLESLFPALTALEDRMLSESSNSTVIAKLEKDVQYWKALAETEATHVIATLKRLDDIDVEYRRLKRVSRNNEKELKERISELEIEVSALTKAFSNVKSIGVVGK